MPDRPPRLAERLLHRLVPGKDGDVIAGDLAEAWAERGGGRLWYWLEVLTCLRVRLSPNRRVLPDLGRDLHYALRVIRRNPGYAVAAMLCLALGIGVNSSVFSFLDGMYFRLLPVPQADRVVAFDRDGRTPSFWRDYLSIRDGIHAFSGIAATAGRGTFMDVERANFGIVTETVSANYADVLRVKPALGRWFRPSDELPGAEPVVVIGDGIWETWFGRDPRVLGRNVRIEMQWYRIVGVAPEEFQGVSAPIRVDAWVPLTTYPIARAQLADPHGPGPTVSLVGRLAARQTVERAAAEIAVIDARLRQAHPRETLYATPLHVRLFRGIPSPAARRVTRSIAILLTAIAGIVLLIACVNVANLLLSRAAVRRREMALRRSLGASRGRLLRQGMAESVILALGGAALGIGFGYATDRALALWMPPSIPLAVLRGIHLQMNWRVAAITAALALVCAVLFSLAPALEGSPVELVSALKSDAPTSRGRRLGQRDLYVIAQVALSLVLLVATGLLLRALQRIERIDPGFATDHRLYVRLFAPDPDFTPEAGTRLFTRLLDEARALPGVRGATLSFDVLGFSDSACVSPSRGPSDGHASINVVEPNYFQLMRIPIVQGSNFSPYTQPVLDTPKAIAAGSPPLDIIVNQTLARRQWPGRDPIGKVLWLGCPDGDPQIAARVIGVARDSKYIALDEDPTPLFYASRRQLWWNGYFALILHTAGDPAALYAPLIQLARTGGPNLRTYELGTFDDVIQSSLWRVRWQARLLGAFGLLALALSVVGLYGVVAYSVAQRTREIGVRMALGAQRIDVQWMVLARGLRLTAAGIAAGLALSASATRFLRGFLYGIDPLDPTAFAAAALAWLFIAMLASYIPARRAARVDPAISLRYE